MPRDVPAPDSLLSQRELLGKFGEAVPEGIKRYWERDRPIEMKPVFLTHYTSREKLPPMQQIWIRATAPVTSTPAPTSARTSRAGRRPASTTGGGSSSNGSTSRQRWTAASTFGGWESMPVNRICAGRSRMAGIGAK